MTSEFVHLHNHSDYSLLDGAQRVNQLVNTIDDLSMDSLALTEHGNMFSVVPFYKINMFFFWFKSKVINLNLDLCFLIFFSFF